MGSVRDQKTKQNTVHVHAHAHTHARDNGDGADDALMTTSLPTDDGIMPTTTEAIDNFTAQHQ